MVTLAGTGRFINIISDIGLLGSRHSFNATVISDLGPQIMIRYRSAWRKVTFSTRSIGKVWDDYESLRLGRTHNSRLFIGGCDLRGLINTGTIGHVNQ